MRAPALQSGLLKLLLTSAAAAALLPAAPASGEAVSFYFGGAAGVTILQSGVVQDAGLSDTDWLGRAVEGLVTRAGAAAPAHAGDRLPRYSRAEVFPYTGWMGLSVLQPDGSIAMIPAEQLANPALRPDGEGGFTLIVAPHRHDWSYLRDPGGEPADASLRAFALALRAIELAVAAPMDAAQFRDFVVEPGQGSARRAYDPESHEGRYAGGLNRLALVTRQLEEPPGLALCASGLFIVAAVFRRPGCD